MKPFHQAACQTQNFKSHFVSNIIYSRGDGDRNGWWVGRMVKREGGCQRGCYFKWIHHSKLVKTEAPGFARCSGTCVGVTDKATARRFG